MGPGEAMDYGEDYAIETKNLSFFYGGRQALFDVNMKIKKGGVTAVIGPSGCGKSTMLRCMNRMYDLLSHTKVQGEITFHGENIIDPKADVVNLRRRIGMVFQKPNPFPKSIYKNIIWGPRVNGFKCNYDEFVEQNLRMAGLWDQVKNRLHESALTLSGGQQQRLCIARSLAMNPDIILMDEPCSALDPMSMDKVEELIHQLGKNYTVIIVTHNMQQALRVSQETAFFYAGHLVEVGLTKKLFEHPSQQKTADYIHGRFG